MTALSRVAWATALALSIAAAAPAEPLQPARVTPDELTWSLPPGGMFTEPARQPHFVWARDGEVVVQIVGYGPSATTWSHR